MLTRKVKRIVCVTLGVLAGSVQAETLQFPDPSMLPSAAQSREDVPHTGVNSGYVYPQSSSSTSSRVQQGAELAMPPYDPAQYLPANPLLGLLMPLMPNATYQPSNTAWQNMAINPVSASVASYALLADLQQQLAASDKQKVELERQLAAAQRTNRELEDKLAALQQATNCPPVTGDATKPAEQAQANTAADKVQK